MIGSAAGGRGEAKSAKLYGSRVRTATPGSAAATIAHSSSDGYMHHIDVAPDGSLQHLHAGRLPRDALVLQLLRLLPHPAEMQIDAVVEQADPDTPPQFGKERGGHMRPAQQRVVEIIAIIGKPLTKCVGIAAIGDLHAHVLQGIGVAWTVMEVLRPELHHHAGPAAGRG